MRNFLWASLLLLIPVFLHAQAKPNFVLILTDDQSYGMMGVTGNPIVKTPHLDQLANESTLFTNAHISSAICTPSRISLLLSQYERKHGVNFNSGTSVSDEAWHDSYPMVMRRAGYYTGWIGKNHSPVGKGGYESQLMEKSFDYWYAAHGHMFFYPKKPHSMFRDAEADTQIEIIREGMNDFLDNNEKNMKNAIRFLDERPANKPFMLSINFNLPHGASTSRMALRESDDEIYKSLYRDADIPLPELYVAKKDIKTPKLPASIHRAEDRQVTYDYTDTPDGQKERYIRQLQAMTGIDRLVGQLRTKLSELKLDKNTVLIFTSDHGLFMGEFGLGGKGLCYEKTTKVPLIVHDPRIQKSNVVSRSSALVQSIDIAPMMAAMAGTKSPEAYQGEDISSLLTDAAAKTQRQYAFSENLWSTHFGNPRCEAVQTEEWKYIRYYKNNTFSATKKIKTAELLGLNQNKMLYGIHDEGMAVYRDYIESPLNGEEAVYEELYHIKDDAMEVNNLIDKRRHKEVLRSLRSAWKTSLVNARGEGKPKIYRYTVDSENE